jgi:iron complex outermembrane receptor protein
MVQSLPGVTPSDQSGNAFQRNLDYRGFTASPVPGTPQGPAVYQNGTRINEALGDVVNWDLIPEMAIARTTLMPAPPMPTVMMTRPGIFRSRTAAKQR